MRFLKALEPHVDALLSETQDFEARSRSRLTWFTSLPYARLWSKSLTTFSTSFSSFGGSGPRKEEGVCECARERDRENSDQQVAVSTSVDTVWQRWTS